MKPIAHRQLFVPVVGSLVTLAWLTLWLWQRSPYGRYLDHTQAAEICLTGGLPSLLEQASLYVAGWLLMTAAMMLPTTLPLLEIFRRLTQQRPDRTRLVALVILGYVGIWLAFGAVAHLVDMGLHTAFETSAWLQAQGRVLGAVPLLVAGAFQFSALKYRCLDKCRAPLGFVMRYWRGGKAPLQALALGAHHGLFCVGCCWALMSLMFAVGMGNLGWMLMLGAVMAIEKNAAWGRKLSAPLGIALLAWGGLIVVNSAWA